MNRPATSAARDHARLTTPSRQREPRPAVGRLTVDQLPEQVAAGRVGTVLPAVPDLQGRWLARAWHERGEARRTRWSGPVVSAISTR
ncbi:hypothetical protein RM550_07090 [Streptomyces sp. DSM 41527]|uniref:Uncharacterized protein n=1 Tax=Streptomyces mooreae TaxID=3075523 RepID=A0ABU2T5I2_9ACTN|nr:hypothetical protein [Streptomyces sp. DSM 41527]MDT0455504.1 hypothetical protein [Streptomyces sp. DSM 41527]